MNGLTEAFSKLGPARLGAMLAVTLALIGFFGFMILRMSQPTMVVLFSDLPFSEALAITKELDVKGIKYETRQDGQTILAPKADIGRIRMEMAAKGIPSGGSVGYEIFDKGDAFSSTSFVQNINHLRALEGELARTIRSVGRVTAARVHLVLPERRVFERDREQPRASIALKLRGELDQSQVRAIRHLVASAVEGLKPERVSIVDEAGRLLADGANEGSPGAIAEERQSAFERRLRNQIEDIVASVVGQGRARVQVSTELDFNRIQQTQETYDPESRVLRSTQTRNEQAQTSGGEGQVSVGNELPGARGQTAQNATRDNSNKSEEIANYDYTKTVRSEVSEAGRVKKISVAVLVDGQYLRNGGGAELAYQPRPQEELDRIATLVRSAIGFDRNRGDTVEIVNLRFAEPPRAPEQTEDVGFIKSLMQPSKDDIYRGVELGVLALLTLLVTLLVVKPLVSRVIAPDDIRARLSQATGGLIAGPAGAAGDSSGNAGQAQLPAMLDGLVPRESATMRYLDMAKVNGQVQAQSLERIGEVVNSNPTEALAILRTMIHQER